MIKNKIRRQKILPFFALLFAALLLFGVTQGQSTDTKDSRNAKDIKFSKPDFEQMLKSEGNNTEDLDGTLMEDKSTTMVMDDPDFSRLIQNLVNNQDGTLQDSQVGAKVIQSLEDLKSSIPTSKKRVSIFEWMVEKEGTGTLQLWKQEKEESRRLHQYEGQNQKAPYEKEWTTDPNIDNFGWVEHDWTTEHQDNSCPDSELYVRYVSSRSNNGGCNSAARIRVLDMDLRQRDRELYLFGDYIDNGFPDYDVYNDEWRRGDCWIARANALGQIDHTIWYQSNDNGQKRGSYCRSLWVERVGDKNEVVAVATKFLRNKPGTTAVLIMRANHELKQGNAKIWSWSDNQFGDEADGYSQFAGDVAMTVDGMIYITGYQRGWDPYLPSAINHCFILRVNLNLKIDWARGLSTTRDEKCWQIQVTRNGEFIFLGGVVIQGTDEYFAFWQLPQNGAYVQKFNLLKAPSTANNLFLRRLILNNRETLVRPGGSVPSGLKSSNNFFWCAWYEDALDNNEENYLIGQLDGDLTSINIFQYGSPDTEKGGDCALTPDNTYIIGGFSTQHTAAVVNPVRIDTRGTGQNCLEDVYTAFNTYFKDYKEEHYSWIHCNHYIHDFMDVYCGGPGWGDGTFGQTADRGPSKGQIYPDAVQPQTKIVPTAAGKFNKWWANAWFRKAVWEGWRENTAGATTLYKDAAYPWEEFSFCIATGCQAQVRKCFEDPPCQCDQRETGQAQTVGYCKPEHPQHEEKKIENPCAFYKKCLEGTTNECDPTLPVCMCCPECRQWWNKMNNADDPLKGKQCPTFCSDIYGQSHCCGDFDAGMIEIMVEEIRELFAPDPPFGANCQNNANSNSNSAANPVCNFFQANVELGKIGFNVWLEFEQDCDSVNDNDEEHYDWYVFKHPVEKFSSANVDKFPEDAVYFGADAQGDQSRNQNQHDCQSGVAFTNSATYCDREQDERLHALLVDDYGYIYVGGHSTSRQLGSCTNAGCEVIEVGLYAKTHWYLVWELRDDTCAWSSTICKEWRQEQIADVDTSETCSATDNDCNDCRCFFWLGYNNPNAVRGYNQGEYDEDGVLIPGTEKTLCRNAGVGDNQCGACDSGYGCNINCHMGLRWTRPMKFTNHHMAFANHGAVLGLNVKFVYDKTALFPSEILNPAGAAVGRIEVDWTTHLTGDHDYFWDYQINYKKWVHILNEHIDEILRTMNDEEDFIIINESTSAYTVSYNDCEDKEFGNVYSLTADKGEWYDENYYYTAEYMNDLWHWNWDNNKDAGGGTQLRSRIHKNCNRGHTQTSVTQAQEMMVNTFFQTLYSEGGASVSQYEIHVNKDQPFIKPLPGYCTDSRYNHKHFFEKGLQPDWRNIKFHDFDAFDAQYDDVVQIDDMLYSQRYKNDDDGFFDTDHEWYIGSPPNAWSSSVNKDRGFYYVDFGGYDVNDELFDGINADNQITVAVDDSIGVIEDYGSYDCKYEWYAWWHDNFHGPKEDYDDNWIQSRNRRQVILRQKFVVHDPAIGPPILIGDMPNFTPTKGQTIDYQFDFTQIFSPYDGEDGCYNMKMTRGQSSNRQVPDWILFNEANSTLQIQAEVFETVYLNLECCNSRDECTEATFKVEPKNLPPTKKMDYQKFVVQYDPNRDVAQFVTWVNTVDMYEDLNSPDMDATNLPLDRYETSDHWVNMLMDQDYKAENYAGVEKIGQYYAQIDRTQAGTFMTFKYEYGDQWDYTDTYDDQVNPPTLPAGGLKDEISWYVNHMPEPLGNFPSEFRTRDPSVIITDYFDDKFKWLDVQDDFKQSEDFYFELPPFCTDQDIGGIGKDFLIYGITFSDGTKLPDWLQVNPKTGVVYGVTSHEYAPAILNLKFSCYDNYGASYSYHRDLKINSPPRTTQGEVIFYCFKLNKCNKSIAEYIYDNDVKDVLTVTFDDPTQQESLTRLDMYFDPITMSFGGRPKYTGTYGWYDLTITDIMGETTQFRAKIIVDYEMPQVTVKNASRDKLTFYITEGLRFFFELPDPLMYNVDFSDLSYVLEQINSSQKTLPTWLTFNPLNFEFGGIAPPYPKEVKIRMTGFNPMTSMQVQVVITIIVLKNNNPKVNLDIWPRDVYIFYDNTIRAGFGSWWQWTVNPELFWDPYNDNWSPRTFCEGSHSSPLPEWLQYSETNHTIYGWANKDAIGVHSVDCTFFDDQGLSIYANFRIIVAAAPMDWAKWIAVLAVTSAGIAALLVYLFYFFDFHTRAINKARLKRLHFKQSVVANITERFNNYRDIELKFYLPDPEDAFVLENHQKPVELEDFNFNESDPEDYHEKIWMLRDR